MNAERGHPDLLNAHLPSWLKAALREAAVGRRSYEDAGWDVGQALARFDVDENAVWDVTAEDLDRPTRALRRILRNDEHPKADMVDYIPLARRAGFLRGIVAGATDREL